MSAKHTPGPWRSKRALEMRDGAWDYAILDGESRIIAETFGIVGYGDSGLRPSEANARFIAAAPEMYEALKRACRLMACLKIRDILAAGDEAILASGLDEWCVNEGKASGDENYYPSFADRIITKAEGVAE
ncbi:MAG: hypothetical protein AAGB48_03100 [Planctomycetota bacterium]